MSPLVLFCPPVTHVTSHIAATLCLSLRFKESEPRFAIGVIYPSTEVGGRLSLSYLPDSVHSYAICDFPKHLSD